MKILKQGLKFSPDETKQFECAACGCVFEMEKGEYKADFSYNILTFYAICPNCKRRIIQEERK